MEAIHSTPRNCVDKEYLCTLIRKCIFRILSVGPIPNHIAFIMDGNRRYARNYKMNEGAGHKSGFLALMSMLKYCYELGVKYVTIYAFSIENFKRKPQEVEKVMDLMQEKIEGLLKEESFVKSYGVRVYFIGNLQLLREPVRVAAEKAMAATCNNDKAVLLICLAYTTTDEIVHAVQEACNEKRAENEILNFKEVDNDSSRVVGEKKNDVECTIQLADVEKHMYMAVAPDPDILVRTSGETRLSNFLLWQTTYCYLYSPSALWPEISFRHLVWGVLNYQRAQPYLEKKKKQC
ncbi:hypothetical protein AQUCO_01600206v1 [Aquilegia coerulea]|uniref:Alkyl transferase n=1 Tax=Aquilegia coerulea TaxID=218851 RepID=A0A2G5DQK1_AQUCA|nr:hypothetical protein AQUCO_01600206v1 [Aquilegia coerulea]